jgi:actin-like ATPase involved in cell morphogenesis
MACGFDAGTYNLVCCHRDDKGNFVHKREVNAFVQISLDDRFLFNMMKDIRTKELPNGVPLIEREDMAYALGEAAVNMAYTLTELELKRPMHEGCVNPKEKDAFEILSIMIHSLLEGVKKDKEVLYYSVPANAINQETDAVYHQKILQSIFRGFKTDEGFTVDAHPIGEGLALVYAELSKKAFTGIGVSFGAGMVNLCFSMFGNPVFQFALVNSGDWIDKMAAKATGENTTFINREKHKIDLTKSPSSLIERAIQTQYRIMIEATVKGIKDGLTKASKSVRADQPVDFVIAGGTSSPKGFAAMFKEVISQAKLTIPIGEIIQPADPLFSVARGALIAAEASQK